MPDNGGLTLSADTLGVQTRGIGRFQSRASREHVVLAFVQSRWGILVVLRCLDRVPRARAGSHGFGPDPMGLGRGQWARAGPDGPQLGPTGPGRAQ